MDDELKYWVAIHKTAGVGAAKFTALETHFGTLKDAWSASEKEFIAAGLGIKTVDAILKSRLKTDPDAEMEALERLGIKPIHLRSREYPAILRDASEPPCVIYVKGELDFDEGRSLAIVGTRKATSYGKTVARQISTELARCGITIVSGLAHGIDEVAHKSSIEAGGKTLAVLAGGLDSIYPASNKGLAERIPESGALISEYPPGVRSLSNFFPRRNRIISGLSQGVLVVEANMDSGAMITGDFAIKDGRAIFAVPGNITSENSKGTNWLIRNGATLVSEARDVLEHLNVSTVQKVSVPPPEKKNPFMAVPLVDRTDECEARSNPVAEALIRSDGPVHIDELVQICKMPASQISSTLTLMELEGSAIQVAPMVFEKV